MFTQEQINEIEQRLALKGTKDSQLPKAELPLKGNETIAIIQDGINKNLPVEVLFKSPIEGTFNVSKYLQLINEEETLVKVSLEEAVTSVPTMAKNEGQTIVFIDSNNTWQCYQYQGDTIDDWEDLLKWKNLNDSSPAPIEEGAQIYNISEYLPGGAKYGQLIGAGVYTIYGDVTPVSQYRTIFGWDPDLGEVLNPEEKDTSLVIKEIDTDGVSAYEYYVFVGNDSDGYGYQATLLSTEEDIPEWIDKAFGNTNDSILVNINKLKEEIDRTKISKGGLKTIQGKSIEGTGNIEISTYINQFASSNNPINWNWRGDGNIGTVDIDNVKGVKASYSEEYETGNVYSVLDVTLKARQHYLFSFYLSGEGECDLSLSDLWDNVYVREFFNPIIIDGDEYIEFDDWRSHLKFTSVGYHYISFYADTNGTAQIDFEFDTNNNIIFYKPLFVACNPKSTISWFVNDEDIFTTKEQFGVAFKGVAYNSTTKKIEFTCVDNTKKYLDATDFVKDGMVSSVAIVNGNLVITFNTDSGKEAISIPLTAIFNPANYYTKTDIDGKLVPATMTTLGLVKLYNTSGTNKSGLLVQEDGGLVVNAPTSMTDTSGVYRDGAGQLKANIKAAATDAEIEAGTSTEKAITPSNLSKVKESFGLATVATSGSYNDLTDAPEINVSEDKVEKILSLNLPIDGYYEENPNCNLFNNEYYHIVRDYPDYTRWQVDSYNGIKLIYRNQGTIQYLGTGFKIVADTNCTLKFNVITYTNGTYADTVYIDGEAINSNINQWFVKELAAGDELVFLSNARSASGGTRFICIKEMQVVSTADIPAKTSDLTNDSGFLTQHQDISGKQDKMPIIQVASGTTAINAVVNTYYEVAGEVGALAITLPTPTDLTKVSMVVIHLTAGTTPNLVVGSTETIDYSAAYDISASKEYEINCLFNGDKWVVADMEVV